jgi:hypothetical protein
LTKTHALVAYNILANDYAHLSIRDGRVRDREMLTLQSP